MSEKCTFGNIEIKPDGVHQLDACVYDEIETFPAMVTLLKCKNCGHEETEFRRLVMCGKCYHGEWWNDELWCSLFDRDVKPEDFCAWGEK